MPGDVLSRILTDVRANLRERKKKQPLAEIRRMALKTPRPLCFERSICGRKQLSFIAEFKRASPSGGRLGAHLDPVRIARKYKKAGAAAISVLTEEDHFGGKLADLDAVAGASGLPVLRKDFIVDEYQLYEARLHRASAVLLIVRILPAARLRSLLRLAHRLRLSVLVEVHNERELKTAVAAGARIIGVNNRDLSSLRIDLGTAKRILPLVPRARVAVAESGYLSRKDLGPLHGIADAALIGTAFLKDPRRLRRMIPGAPPN